jgi:hypothetical protein
MQNIQIMFCKEQLNGSQIQMGFGSTVIVGSTNRVKASCPVGSQAVWLLGVGSPGLL